MISAVPVDPIRKIRKIQKIFSGSLRYGMEDRQSIAAINNPRTGEKLLKRMKFVPVVNCRLAFRKYVKRMYPTMMFTRRIFFGSLVWTLFAPVLYRWNSMKHHVMPST